MLKLFALFALIAVVIRGLYKSYMTDKKNWNNGICADTGKPWVQFDVDSQGGRGYISSNDIVTKKIWISWNSVDKDHG